ncbi:MAG TPA: UDP-2,3-diacylglucosamine diphosphatase LpxI [Pirellulales bacterium]|jgi:hypothetical protein|nr:UDP-2,3-diacylglucosamine diphosphatase LpxI [Pirellulales bacterium]
MSLATAIAPAPVKPTAPRRVGLIAGWGRYPILVAEELRRQGCETYCVGLEGHADPILAELCAGFCTMGFGRLGRAIRYMRQHGVHDATMAGKVHKLRLFTPWMWARQMPDWRTWRRFAKHFLFAMKDRKDDTLLRAVIDEFALDGIHFAPATEFAPELLVKPGNLTRRVPSRSERRDIEFGWKIAKELGRLDIGQCVAVKREATLALEAIEGTDRCIERAGELCTARNFTVVKVAKPKQDMRFDVPTIGVGTLETMVRAGASCLAIEAGRTILLDQQDVIAYADRHKLAIVALDAEGAGA